MIKNKYNIYKFQYYLLWLAFVYLPVFSLHANEKTGKVEGTVLNEHNQPLANVTISLFPDNRYVKTNQQGKFSIESLYSGRYELRASLMGYETYIQQLEVKTNKTTSVNIKLSVSNFELKEVSVASQKSAPDNLLNIERSAMPVTIIDRRTIELMGSRRLDEILKEQTGIAIVNNIKGGARSVGVQMQGFGSEYVIILIDGQPMLGRNDGNFDLSRISVTNIERIEIIKGASSCLFGSEALGGAINIITRHGALEPQAHFAAKYGSLNIVDITAEGETPFASQRGSVNLSANYYRTDGFNTDPAYVLQGTTAPPYNNYSIQSRARYQTGKTTYVSVSGRYALRQSLMDKDFGLNNASGNQQDEHDINLSANFSKTFKNRLQSLSRYYFTSYKNKNHVDWQSTGTIASSDVFIQNFNRFEQQLAYSANNYLKFTGGFGGSVESMKNEIFGTKPYDVYAGFAYTQGDWTISEKLEAVGGLRYDHHSSYGGRLNPSLGLQYHITSDLTLKLAAGSGFKAPDFKTRYLVFYNPLSNYRVIGTEVLASTLEELKNAGQISEIREYLVKQLGQNLVAEKSNSFNLGVNYRISDKLKIEGGAFYHKIFDQINAIQVATSINNGQIYTYQNLPEVENKGAEFSFAAVPLKNMEVNFGYQYLISRDLSVVEKIKNGEFPYSKIRNSETGETWESKVSDYWGIENRSRHMFNFRTVYQIPSLGLIANFRVNYRGKYPFLEISSNQFIDKYDHFVEGFFLLNAGIEKKIQEKLRLQITVDNMMDYYHRDIPGQPGRVILAGISYRFFKND